MEKCSFEQHNVYDLVPRGQAATAKKRVFGTRPVFKIKVKPPTDSNPNPEIDRFKFRQTIKAFTKMMTPGIDFAEKRASTVRWEASLCLLATAVLMDYDIALFDVKTFFLYGILTDLVFMEQPPEWEDPAHPAADWICKLNRSMYGLPQAPHCAQTKLKATLTAQGEFRQTTADDCVYVSGKPSDDDYVATGTHVDDLLSVGTTKGLAKLSTTLKKQFEIVEDNPTAMITGVQIVRDRKAKTLRLHQSAYIATILKEFGQEDCTPTDTPMDPGTVKAFMALPVDAPDDSRPTSVALKTYRKLVGMLIWLYKTRPDMLFTVNLLSRYLHNATQAHLDLARGRPLRYLRGSMEVGLMFEAGARSQWRLSGEADADFAGDLESSRSLMGHVCKVGKYGAVSFNCTLERKVSTSTQQAETYALASLCKSTVWLRQLFHELGFPQDGPTPQGTDNRGAFLQSTKQVNHASAKHFRVEQAFIRQLTGNGTIRVDKVSTDLMSADIFTKALTKIPFLKHRDTIMGPQR